MTTRNDKKKINMYSNREYSNFCIGDIVFIYMYNSVWTGEPVDPKPATYQLEPWEMKENDTIVESFEEVVPHVHLDNIFIFVNNFKFS